MKFMRTMLENAKQNAGSAKEREQAAAALAELDKHKDEMAQQAAEMDAMQPEIDKMRAEAGVMAGAGQGMASVGVTRLTRIADTCTAPTR
jgi:Asp/Glu/hydantoin racemase